MSYFVPLELGDLLGARASSITLDSKSSHGQLVRCRPSPLWSWLVDAIVVALDMGFSSGVSLRVLELGGPSPSLTF